MKHIVTIYTDGASRGNPGPGGWAAILMTDEKVIELVGSQNPATNNQMELGAVIGGLGYAFEHFPDSTIELHADSTYVLKGIESWLDGWVRKGWVTMAKKPVENRVLWEELLALRNHFGKRLELTKVEGHSGHIYNDRCDELAVAAALGKSPNPFVGTLKEYETFLQENPPVSPMKKPEKKSSSSEKAYSYVSLVDGIVHADKTWAECEKRVKGKKAKFKKVFSKAEETELIQDYTLSILL